eukprot:20924-Amphidinium_carterae.1
MSIHNRFPSEAKEGEIMAHVFFHRPWPVHGWYPWPLALRDPYSLQSNCRPPVEPYTISFLLVTFVPSHRSACLCGRYTCLPAGPPGFVTGTPGFEAGPPVLFSFALPRRSPSGA